MNNLAFHSPLSPYNNILFLDKPGHHYVLFENPCPYWSDSISFRKVIHLLCFSQVHLYMALTIPCLSSPFWQHVHLAKSLNELTIQKQKGREQV